MRPAPEMPAASVHWQVRVSISGHGLALFAHGHSELGRERWREWLHLSVASEQGSDMLSALHSLLYFDKLKANVSVYWDVSHGCNRDFWNSVNDVSLKSFMLLIMICINLPHGPDDSDLRFGQIKDVMGQHYLRHSASTSPILQHLCYSMLRGRHDELQTVDTSDREPAMWELLKAANGFRRKGYKCNIGRVFQRRRRQPGFASPVVQLSVRSLRAGLGAGHGQEQCPTVHQLEGQGGGC